MSNKLQIYKISLIK